LSKELEELREPGEPEELESVNEKGESGASPGEGSGENVRGVKANSKERVGRA
jgi:hypothetical protein